MLYSHLVSAESDGEGRSSKFSGEDGQAGGEKMARAGVCDVSGVTSSSWRSCTVTRAIRNVHDQPGLSRTRPAVENLLRPVEFKTIPQLRILNIRHQWRNISRTVTQDFLAIFGSLFDRVPVRILISIS